MGATGVRKKIRHDENTRAKIQTSMIINRLQNHLEGHLELSQTQVRCAEILLRKTLPDLTATEMTAEVVHSFAMVPAVMSKEDWLRTRGDPKLLEHAPQPVARREDKSQVAPPVAKDPNSKLN